MVPAERLRTLKTVMTIVGGKIVFRVGDVTGDGTVRIDDLVRLIRFLSERDEPSERQRIAADVNADGERNVVDIVAAVSVALGSP
jgi:hypothetical protein